MDFIGPRIDPCGTTKVILPELEHIFYDMLCSFLFTKGIVEKTLSYIKRLPKC